MSGGTFASPGMPSAGAAQTPSPGTFQPLLLGDSKIDQVLLANTGLNSMGHMNLMQEYTTQLSEGVNRANSLVLDLGQSLQSDTLSFGNSLSADLTNIQMTTTGDLSNVFAGVLSNVKGTVEGARSKTTAAMQKAQEQVTTVRAKSVKEEQRAFKAAASMLGASKAEWEGSYEKTVRAQAQKMRDMGASYQSAAKAKEDGHRANYKALGKTGNSGDALTLAEERATADTFKAYGPEFTKYAKLAALFLEDMAMQAKPLSDKLLAPTLDALYPLEETNSKTLQDDSNKLNKQLEKEKKNFEKATTAIEKTQVKSLETGGKDAVNEVNQASMQLQGSTEVSLDTLNQQQATAVGQIQTARLNTMTAVDEISQQLSGSTDAAAFEAGKTELLSDLDQDTTVVLQVLESDQKNAKDGVRTKHNAQTTIIKASAKAHSERVIDAGVRSVDAVQTATDSTHQQLNKLSKQGNAAYTGVGKATAQQALDSTTSVDTTSKEYQTELLAQVSQYMASADIQMQTLYLNAVTESQTAAKTARGTQASALKTRSDNIYKAIDGWGTDESTLMKQMSGLTKSEARFTAAHYKDQRGESLRQAIIDDTSSGDNVRKSCLAYLEGKQALGAKYALKYASEGIWRAYGSDMDLVNSTMMNLNEESRTELLQDEDFPAIKATIQRPTIAMNPAMILSTGGQSYVGNAFFGPGKYDLDTFAALSDPEKTLEQAKDDVQVIELAKAFDTDSMNPFKQGTDESKVFEILGKLEGEALEKFKAKFKAYKGVSLEAEIQDEFVGSFEEPLEYKRAMALANGDKAAADAFALEYSLNNGKEEQVFGLLEDPNLVAANEGGGGWLANQKAKQARQKLNTAYEKQTKSTLSADIDTKLAGEDEYASEIAQSHLKGETADPRHLLAFAILGGGTNEPYAQKAIQQLLQDVKKEQDKAKAEGRDGAEAGKRAWQEMKDWFKTHHGITDLEKYLGVGDSLYAKDLRELDGQERQDFNDVLMQVTAEPDNVIDEYKRVKGKWEWYRGKGGTPIGSGLMDLYSDSGGDLDHKMDVINKLMKDDSWYDTKTGKPHKMGSPNHVRFLKYVELLDGMGGIYNDQRSSLTDAICTVVTSVAAIISTIVTLGAAGPLWVAVAISAGAASLNVVIKANMKGNAYGPGEAMNDVASIAGEALVSMATMGLGPAKFQQFGKFLNNIADKGLRMKLLSEVIKGVPGEVQGLLMNEKTWTGDWDEFAAMLSVSSFKLGANAMGGVINEKLADQVADPGKKWMGMISEPITEILADPDVMAGDEIGLVWLKKVTEKFVGNAGAEVSLRHVSSKINKLVVLDAKTKASLGDISPDAAADLQTRLNIEHQTDLHTAHPDKFKKPVVPVKKDVPDSDKVVADVVEKHMDKGENHLQEVLSDVSETVVKKVDGKDEDIQTSGHVEETVDQAVSTKNLEDTDPRNDKRHEDVHPDAKLKSNDTKSDGVPVALTGLQGETLRRSLDDVHGIGPVLSKKVQDYIEGGGNLDSHTDLQSITGIGPVLSERIWSKVKGRAELHNHQNGVFEVEDMLELHASKDEAGKVKVLDHLESTYNQTIDDEITDHWAVMNDPKASQAAKKRVIPAIEKLERTRKKIKELIDQRNLVDAAVSNDKLLQELLVTGKLDYDEVYSVRSMVQSMGIKSGAKGYFDVLLKRLASQGISYIEVTGGHGKQINDVDLRSLMDTHGVEIRFLKSIRSRETLGLDDKQQALKNKKNGMEANIDKALSTERPDSSHTVGIDYLGAEPMFQEGGKQAFIESSLDMSSKLKQGQIAVIRVHVGEGYFSEGKDRAAEVKLAKDNIQGFIDSVKVIQAKVKESGVDGEIQIRAGHVTHATDAQLVELRQLGVHVEVNLGSNKKTRAVTDFAEHPLLRMLYLGVDLSINTDAGGVMATTLQDEYRQAESMIEAFKAGSPIEIDGKAVYYKDMSTIRKNRFDIQRLEESSRQYQQIDRDNK